MALPTAYNPDGTPISDADLHAAIAKGPGSVGFSDDPITFEHPVTGETYKVPGSKAWNEIQKGMKVIPNSEAIEREKQKAVSESTPEMLKTVGMGALRYPTFGLSDVVAEDINPDYAAEQARREKAFTAANTGAEIGGGIASMFVPGGAGKVIGAPGKIAQGIGKAATEVIPEGIGRSVARGVVGGAVEGGYVSTAQEVHRETVYDEGLTAEELLANPLLGGALGGAFGLVGGVGQKATGKLQQRAAQKYSDAADQYINATKETYAPSAGVPAEKGPLASGPVTIPDLSGVAPEPSASAFVEDPLHAAMRQKWNQKANAMDRISKFNRPLEDIGSGKKKDEEPVLTPEEKAQGLLGRAKNKIQDYAAQEDVNQVLKSSQLTGAPIKALEKDGIPAARIAGRIIDEAGVEIGDSVSTVVEKTQAAMHKAGQQFDQVEGALDNIGFKTDTAKIISDIDNNVLSDVRKSSLPAERRLADAVDKDYIRGLREEVFGPKKFDRAELDARMRDIRAEERTRIESEVKSKPEWQDTPEEQAALKKQIREELRDKDTQIEDAAKQRLIEDAGIKSQHTFGEITGTYRKIEEFINKHSSGKSTSPKTRLAAQVADQIKASLIEQIEKANPQIAELFKKANFDWRDWSNITKKIEQGASLSKGRRTLGLSEQIAAHGGGTLGTLVGVAHGAHALMTGGLGAVGGMLGGKILKSAPAGRFGAKILHAIAGERALYGNINKIAAETSGKTAEKITSLVSKNSFSASGKSAKVVSMIAGSLEQYKDVKDKIEEAAANQGPHNLNHLAELQNAHPGVYSQVAQSQTKGLEMIAGSIPKPAQIPNPILGDNQVPAAKSEQKAWLERVNVAQNPGKFLDDVIDGKPFNRNEADTFRNLLPRMSEELQKHTLAAINKTAATGKIPNMQTQLQIGLLTGQPINPADTPEFIANIQKNYSQPAAPPSGPAGGGKHGHRGGSKQSLSSRLKTDTENIGRIDK